MIYVEQGSSDVEPSTRVLVIYVGQGSNDVEPSTRVLVI